MQGIAGTNPVGVPLQRSIRTNRKNRCGSIGCIHRPIGSDGRGRSEIVVKRMKDEPPLAHRKIATREIRGRWAPDSWFGLCSDGPSVSGAMAPGCRGKPSQNSGSVLPRPKPAVIYTASGGSFSGLGSWRGFVGVSVTDLGGPIIEPCGLVRQYRIWRCQPCPARRFRRDGPEPRHRYRRSAHQAR